MSDIWRRKKLNSLRNRDTAFYNDIKNFKANSNLDFNHSRKIIQNFHFRPNFNRFSFLTNFRIWPYSFWFLSCQSKYFSSIYMGFNRKYLVYNLKVWLKLGPVDARITWIMTKLTLNLVNV